ncbi:hypothetical protein GCM10020295_19910 [Streptomyces cinereospinus]
MGSGRRGKGSSVTLTARLLLRRRPRQPCRLRPGGGGVPCRSGLVVPVRTRRLRQAVAVCGRARDDTAPGPAGQADVTQYADGVVGQPGRAVLGLIRPGPPREAAQQIRSGLGELFGQQSGGRGAQRLQEEQRGDPGGGRVVGEADVGGQPVRVHEQEALGSFLQEETGLLDRAAQNLASGQGGDVRQLVVGEVRPVQHGVVEEAAQHRVAQPQVALRVRGGSLAVRLVRRAVGDRAAVAALAHQTGEEFPEPRGHLVRGYGEPGGADGRGGQPHQQCGVHPVEDLRLG